MRSPEQRRAALAIFDNPAPDRDYEIHIETPEFTSLCPVTGQPDFATIALRYVPADRCVELKSLKLYYWGFRQEGHFHEAVTNLILDDLVAVLTPRYLVVEGIFNVRGGIYTRTRAVHGRRPDDWGGDHRHPHRANG